MADSKEKVTHLKHPPYKISRLDKIFNQKKKKTQTGFDNNYHISNNISDSICWEPKKNAQNTTKENHIDFNDQQIFNQLQNTQQDNEYQEKNLQVQPEGGIFQRNIQQKVKHKLSKSSAFFCVKNKQSGTGQNCIQFNKLSAPIQLTGSTLIQQNNATNDNLLQKQNSIFSGQNNCQNSNSTFPQTQQSNQLQNCNNFSSHVNIAWSKDNNLFANYINQIRGQQLEL